MGARVISLAEHRGSHLTPPPKVRRCGRSQRRRTPGLRYRPHEAHLDKAGLVKMPISEGWLRVFPLAAAIALLWAAIAFGL